MTKIVTLILSPLGGVFLLLVWVGWWIWRDEPKRALGTLVAAVLWTYAWSCPWVAEGVTGWWEAQYPPSAMRDVPEAAVVVTLGGAMGGAVPPRRIPDLNAAADRVWQAARLYHAGKAGKILVSGGGGRATGSPEERGSEAEDSVPFLIDLGVPREAILLEKTSRNTIENARQSAAGLRSRGSGRVLLVTSATHMPRAMQAFRHVGLDPFPVATDVRGVRQPNGFLRFVPTPDALQLSSVTIKEVVGTAWYRLAYGAGGGERDE